ncbi:MAG TPA: FtsX-like permease family protein [Acidimicrobiales bacterium]|jgi:putative ABC transport system permease protein|nr:FtsX-like permease family protein [Acidimicrobiales bacterium]
MPAVALISLPFLVAMVARPVWRRLAMRNAVRRPRETILVLVGSLLGTAIITGSFVVGETLEASIRRSAFTQLGPVDEVVQAPDQATADRARAAVEGLDGAPIDGVVPVLTLQAAAVRPGADPRAEPRARVVELDFDAGRAFGGDAGATGIEGATPSGDRVAIGRDLARTLEVERGDAVEVLAYGRTRSFTVERVLPRLGLAGFKVGFGSESPNLFVAPGTIASMAADPPPGAAPPVPLVLVSNAGGVEDGAAHTAAVEARLHDAFEGLPVSVDPVKDDLLEAADEAGAQFTELFTAIGFFSVLAGILLVVNIFVMLAQERRGELGMLRAVGLRRSAMVASFSMEGWLYALASAAAGTIVGLGVGRLIVLVAAGIFADGGDFSLELRYTATFASIQSGFVTGFFISLATVVLTSFSIARLNVIRAIRDLPEPIGGRQRAIVLVPAVVALVAGGALTFSGLSNQDAFGVLAGPALAALGIVPLLRRFVPRRPLVSVTSGLVLVWAVACFDVASEAFENPEIWLFVVDGVILTGAAVALVSQNQDVLGALVRRIAGGSSMALRIGLAYPLARRFRTGMILTMYALVVFTLTSITLFSRVFSSQIDDFTADVAGRFDLKVQSNAASPVSPEQVAAVPGVAGVATLTTAVAEFAPRDDPDPMAWPVAGFTEDFVALGPPVLDERPPGAATDADAYRAVLADPGLVIVDEFFLQDGGGPPEEAFEIGATLTVRDPSSGRSRTLEVGAVAKSGFAFTPALMSADALAELAGPLAAPTLLYVDAEPGFDPQAVAEEVNATFVANGADAVSFRKEVGDGLSQQSQFFRLMQGYLALGLVVGIAGLGVVMVRAVWERRRQVGVLRALGFPSGAVRRAFVAESMFVALEGIVLGVLLAVVSSWRLLTNGAFGEGLSFTVPWLQLALLVVLTAAASVVATIAPAQQASRIRPAVALRLAD